MGHFDVLIVGAGLSGIGAGAHNRMELPGKPFVIFEVWGQSVQSAFTYLSPAIRSGH